MLDGKSGAKRPTDLVLCEASVVRLIAEIKFVPHYYPEWKRDIQKLNEIAQLDSEGHEFLIEPASGQFSGEKHCVNPHHTRYAFIAVGRDDSEAVDLQCIKSKHGALLPPRFSLCFGRIRTGAEPCFGVKHSDSDPALGATQ